MSALRQQVLDGIRAGRPTLGPLSVHVDVTNACNAACVTCWDHSPLLTTPRPTSWKRRQLSLERFGALVDDLVSMGSVQAVVLSGMGDPLVHPGIYEMMARVRAEGWHLTVLSNLVAADIDRLVEVGVDNLLVGVQGTTPDTYTRFHPGWSEAQFFRLTTFLRRLQRAGVSMRHVQVIDRNTAEEVVEMVRFGKRFGAQRVNYKLASLSGGTEATAATPAQLERLTHEDVPAARALADELGVRTNLDLFAQQLQAALGTPMATTPIADVGCFMGHVYTRITVDGQVLYCCNTEVEVGTLDDGPVSALWRGEAWQALREQLAAGEYFPGCARCGKFEQNVKWRARLDAGP